MDFTFCLFQCEGVPEAQKLIDQLLQLIPPMKSTISLGIQPEAKDCTKNGRFFFFLLNANI